MEIFAFLAMWCVLSCLIVYIIDIKSKLKEEKEIVREMSRFKMIRPVQEGKVSQDFGARYAYYWKNFGLPGHEGIDFAVPEGTEVLAVADAVVKMVFHDNGKHPYGNHVKLLHVTEDGTFETVYAHLSDFAPGLVKGAVVYRGNVIALSGNTGNSTGPHLHFTVKRWGATQRKEKQLVAGNREVTFPSDVVDPRHWFLEGEL